MIRSPLREVAVLFARSEDIRRQLQVALNRNGETRQCARQRNAVQVVLPRKRRPVRRLVPAPDVSLKVDSPLLHVGRGIAKRAEGNRELRAPPALEHFRFNLPGPIPVDVEPSARTAGLSAAAGTATASTAAPTTAAASSTAAASPSLSLADHLSVVLDSRRAGPEDKPVLAIAEGVEDDEEAIGVGERRVTAAFGADDEFR
jgi:hypothetical protein